MNSKLKVVICTLGTSGDILPFLQIARRLKRDGMNVVFMTNENWRLTIHRHVDKFIAIAPKDLPQSGRNEYKFFKANTLQSFYKSFDFLKQDIPPGAGNTVLIYRSNMKGCEYFAEKYMVPSMCIALQPSAIKSFHNPPWPFNSAKEARFSNICQSFVILSVYRMSAMLSRYRWNVNRFRRHVGIRSPGLLNSISCKADRTIVLCPEWFSMPQIDWPRNTFCLGFPRSTELGIQSEADRFIFEHGRPLVFTPGTGVTDVSDFFNKAKEICDIVNVPGIFLSRELEEGNAVYGNRIFCRKYIDLSSILKNSLLLVHHGGIGTVSKAVEASIPQLIFPNKYDQPDNAFRIAQLGLGAAVFDQKISSTKLSEIIVRMLSDDEMFIRLKIAASSIRNSNAIEDTVRIIWDLAEEKLYNSENAVCNYSKTDEFKGNMNESADCQG